MNGMKKQSGILLLIFCAFFSTYTKDKRARSADAFYRLLSSAPYSLVVFYDRSKSAMRNDVTKEDIKDLEVMLRSLSKNPLYKGADLQIVRVDIGRRDLGKVAQEYAIETLPTYMIFLGREPIGNKLTGFAYRSKVNALIDQNLKEKMNVRLKEKEKERKRELEAARIRAYNRAYYWGPYWYGGYYPYWRGPYFRSYWW